MKIMEKKNHKRYENRHTSHGRMTELSNCGSDHSNYNLVGRHQKTFILLFFFFFKEYT